MKLTPEQGRAAALAAVAEDEKKSRTPAAPAPVPADPAPAPVAAKAKYLHLHILRDAGAVLVAPVREDDFHSRPAHLKALQMLTAALAILGPHRVTLPGGDLVYEVNAEVLAKVQLPTRAAWSHVIDPAAVDETYEWYSDRKRREER